MSNEIERKFSIEQDKIPNEIKELIALCENKPVQERKEIVEKLNQLSSKMQYQVQEIKQTYLIAPDGEERRVRSIDDEKFYKTVKTPTSDPRQRIELETPIDKENYDIYLHQKEEGTETIHKTRFKISIENGLTYELDIFHNKELNEHSTIEVEFDTKEDAENFNPPEWFGEDITSNKKFSNHKLAKEVFEKKQASRDSYER